MLFRIGFLTITIFDLLDITLVAFVFYKFYQFIRGSVAARMIVGLLIIMAFSVLAELANLSGVSWIFSNLKTIWVIAFVIIFQPEFRRLLLYMGQNPIIQRFVSVEQPRFIEEVVGAAVDLSHKNFGALIVLLQETGIKGIVETGLDLTAAVSRPLLMSIFNPRSPLHDGAVVVQSDIILAAKCQLPLTQNPEIDHTYGMRHRAALGLSEQTDSIVLVVSEETGQISIAENGVLDRNLSEEELLKRLNDTFVLPNRKKFSFSDFLHRNEYQEV